MMVAETHSFNFIPFASAMFIAVTKSSFVNEPCMLGMISNWFNRLLSYRFDY